MANYTFSERKRSKSISSNQTTTNIFERIEYFLFVFLGGCIWSLIVVFGLKWIKFPFRRHLVLIGCVIIIPIIVIAYLLSLVDYPFKIDESKEE